MKYVLLSDFHITDKNPPGRKDNIKEVWRRKLDFILKYAQENEAIILQAGDMFDIPRDWNVLFKMISILKHFNITIYSIVGQHDMYFRADMKKTPTTLGVLEKLGLINILSNERPLLVENFSIWGCGWKQPIPKPRDNCNILVIHKSISDSALWPGQDFTNAHYFIRKNPFRVVLVGDIHKRFFFEHNKDHTICNTGPILRLAATKYNMKHKPCFFVYDSYLNYFEKIKIPHEPAEEIFDRTYLEENARTNDITEQFVESLKSLPEDREHHKTVKELIMKYMVENKIEQPVIDFLSEIIENEDTN